MSLSGALRRAATASSRARLAAPARAASASSGGPNHRDFASASRTAGHRADPFVISGSASTGRGSAKTVVWVPSGAGVARAAARSESAHSAAFERGGQQQQHQPQGAQQQQQPPPRGQQRREFHQPHAAQPHAHSQYQQQPQQPQQQQRPPAQASSSPSPPRVYRDFAVYKSKTACKFAVIRPTFETKPDGSRSKRRDGGMLLEFAPAVGQRQYDWSRKQTILLSPLELVELTEALHLGRGVNFFHDPGMGTGRQGETTKSLKAEPMPDGSGGIFLNMATTAPGGKGDERASRCPSPSLPRSGTSPRFSCRGSWGSRRCSSIPTREAKGSVWRGCKVRERRGSDEAARRGGDAWERLRRSKRRRRRIRHDARVVHVPSRLSRAEGPPLARHRAVDCNAHAAVTAAMMNAARRGTCVFAPESSSSLTSTRGGTHAVSWPVGSSPAARVSPMRTPRKFPKTRARPSRIRTRYPSRWRHRQPRGVIRPCTPRTRSTPRARSRRTESPRTRYPSRWGHRQPRESRQMRTPRTRSTPRARSRRTEPPRTRYPSRWGSSPAARVSPDAHATHAFDATCSFAPHRAAAHAVSEPVGSSPAARVSPDAHATQVPDDTRSRAQSRRARSWGHRQPRESRPMRTPRSRRHVLVRRARSTPRKFPRSRVGSSPAARVSPDAHATHAFDATRSFVAHPHAVSWPVGSSPAARSDPPVHATQVPEDTRSFAAHRVAAHAVSEPVGSSPAARVSPDAHATHAFDATRSFVAHPHAVSEPVASSPAARSDPPVHATHAFDATRSFAAHRAAAHAVSEPVGSSPAARVSPDAHATHAFDATRSFVAHPHAVSEPVASSPAARSDPPVHATHVVRRHALVRGAQSRRARHRVRELTVAARPSPRQRESRVARGNARAPVRQRGATRAHRAVRRSRRAAARRRV